MLIKLLFSSLIFQLGGSSTVHGSATVRAPGNTSVPALPSSNLVGWWEFIGSVGGDGSAGNTIPDLSGNSHTLTISGPANPVNPTPSNQGMNFTQVIASPLIKGSVSVGSSTPKTIIVIFQSQLSLLQGYMVSTLSTNVATGVFIEYRQTFQIVPDVTVAANPPQGVVTVGAWNFGAIRNSGVDNNYIQNLNTTQAVTGSGPSLMTVDQIEVGNGNTAFVGIIAEVLLYSQELSDDDLVRAYEYLKARVATVGIVI